MIRKILIISGLVFFSLNLLLASENLKVEKLSKHTYAVFPKEGGKAISNSVFIILDDGVLLIDSQASEELAKELAREIKKVTSKPVKYLVNTHFHRDHIGGNSAFLPHAQLILHHMAFERFKEDRVVLQGPIISIKYELSIIDNNNQIQIIWLGTGHTKGDLFIYFPEDGILVLGDLFFNEVIPTVKDGHIKHWLAVLDRVIKSKMSNIKIVIPGHGPAGDFTALRRFRELLAWSRGVVESELGKETEREKIVEVAKETRLYKTRIHQYSHQERLQDLINKVYQEFTKTIDNEVIQQ